jgi:hypothetical protein
MNATTQQMEVELRSVEAFARHRTQSEPRTAAAMGEEKAEKIARIIDPSAWAVMDGYLEQTKRKYRGQNVAWPADQFKHKESMAKARAILATLSPTGEEKALREEVIAEALGCEPEDFIAEARLHAKDMPRCIQRDYLNAALNKLERLLAALREGGAGRLTRGQSNGEDNNS